MKISRIFLSKVLCVCLKANIQKRCRMACEDFNMYYFVHCGRRGNLCGHVWTSSAFYPGLQYQSLTCILYPHISSHNCQYKIDPTFLKYVPYWKLRSFLDIGFSTAQPVMGINGEVVDPIINKFIL